jgi:hypothetical protein
MSGLARINNALFFSEGVIVGLWSGFMYNTHTQLKDINKQLDERIDSKHASKDSILHPEQHEKSSTTDRQ